jgi:hypothetical protein
MNNQTNANVGDNSALQIAVGGSNFAIQKIWQKGVNSFKAILL